MPSKLANKLTILASALLISIASLLPIAASKALAATSTNLIANPLVNTVGSNNLPTSWLEGGYGTNSTTYSYLNTGTNDTNSLKVSMTKYSSGDAKWYFTPVSVTAGDQYTYSDYYESKVATDVVVQFGDASGNYTYQDLGTASASANSFEQYTASFTVPSSVTNVTVFHLISSVGTLTTDDFSLTQVAVTPPPPPTPGSNLIANPLVNTASSTNSSLPASWLEGGYGTNSTTYSYLNTGTNDTNSLKVSISKYTSGDAKWYFTPVDVTAGDQYTYSDYYESGIASDVVVQYEDASGNYTYQDLGSAAASNNAFKQYSATFTVPASVVNVTVFHLISAVGTLTTDDFSLTQAITATPPPVTSDNLVPNPMINTATPGNANLPNDWSQDGWGTNTDTTAYNTTGGYGGGGEATINMTSYTSGDQKFYFNPVAVTQDTQYNFTDYYESNVQTVVDAVFNLSNGTTDYEYIGLPGPASTWTKFSTDFAIPLGTTSMTIYHLIQSVGTLSTSDFSMTPYTPVGFNRALVSLTFDDGYQDTYTYGLPILQAAGMPSTQFVITDLVGQPNYMTVAEVQALHNDGEEVASHTVTHDDMTQETATQVTTELSQSQSTLEGWIGAPVTDMAYPYGLYNSSVQAATSEYYGGARGVEVGLNSKDSFNADDIKVENIYDTTTTAQVADWVAQAQATKTWLVFVYHSVDPSSNPFGGEEWNVTPTQLTDQLAAIKSSGVTVETMQQALAEVEAQL